MTECPSCHTTDGRPHTEYCPDRYRGDAVSDQTTDARQAARNAQRKVASLRAAYDRALKGDGPGISDREQATTGAPDSHTEDRA